MSYTYSAIRAPIIYIPPTRAERLLSAARDTLVSVAVALVGLGVPWVGGAFVVM